jgi:hypothetical protein
MREVDCTNCKANLEAIGVIIILQTELEQLLVSRGGHSRNVRNNVSTNVGAEKNNFG